MSAGCRRPAAVQLRPWPRRDAPRCWQFGSLKVSWHACSWCAMSISATRRHPNTRRLPWAWAPQPLPPATAAVAPCGIHALPDDLLSGILALLPDDADDFLDMAEGGGVKVSSRRAAWGLLRCGECFLPLLHPLLRLHPCCRGAAEHVCLRWRRLALALPASRITFDFVDSVWGEDDPGFVPAVVDALRRRAVGRLEICNAPGSLPPGFWESLGEGLVARARGYVGLRGRPCSSRHCRQDTVLASLPLAKRAAPSHTRRLSISHETWHAGCPLPPGALELLSHGSAVEQFNLSISDLDDEGESLAPKLAETIRCAGCPGG